MKNLFLIACILLVTYSTSLIAQNNALDFDGTDDYIQIPDFSEPASGTIEMWILTDAIASEDENPTFGNGNKGALSLAIRVTDDYSLRFSVRDNANWVEVYSNANSISTSIWTHIAVTWNATTANVYVNGILENSGVLQSSPISATGNWHIGGSTISGAMDYFAGKIDEVRIWNDVRTTGEIRQNMHRELTDPGSEGNLLAYYKLNETSDATTAVDSKSTNNGALIGYGSQSGFWQTSPAMFGPKNCLDFDGSDDYVDLTNSSHLKPTDSLTFECWINPDDWSGPANPNHDVFAGNTDDGFGYNIALGYPDASHIGFAVSSGGYKRIDADLTGYTGWHHVAGTFDGQFVRLYVDGVMMDELDMGTSGNTISYDTDNSTILGEEAGEGSIPAGNNYAGKLDEVRFWNVARTANEIRANMCKNLTGNESGLVAYYNFDNESVDTLQDFSENEIDGTLYNMDNADWVASSAFNIWLNTSTSSTNWATASNWSQGAYPNASTENVGIPDYSVANDPEISSAVEINNLVVGDEATLTFDYSGSHTIHGSVFNIGTTNLEANTDLTITGSLYVLPLSTVNIKALADLTIEKNLDLDFLLGDGTLNMYSDASGTGSMIVNGTSSGDITLQRYIAELSRADAWHYVTASVSGQALNDTWMNDNSIATSSGQYQFYRWDEDTDYWIYYDYTGSDPEDFGDNTFVDARAYTLTATGAQTLSFTGSVITSNTNYAATYTENKGWGWNLVGNPFSSTIAITDEAQATDNFLADNAAIIPDSYEAIYVWDEQSAYTYGRDDYKVICNTGFLGEGSGSQISQDYVSPGQGFMVKVNTTGNIVFNEDIRKHGTADFYKEDESWPGIELGIAGNGYVNSTIVAFHENMTKGLDPSYDAAKLKGNPNIALYTRLIEDNDKDFAIQALPCFEEDYSVPLGVDIIQAGTYTFEAVTMEQIPGEVHIYLEDLEAGTLTDLKETNTYTCVLDQSGSITDRFVLHFTLSAFGQEELEADNSTIQLWSNDKTINIYNPDGKTGRVSVVNLLGQPVAETLITGDVKQEITLHVPSGFYLVTILSENYMTSRKVYIENE